MTPSWRRSLGFTGSCRRIWDGAQPPPHHRASSTPHAWLGQLPHTLTSHGHVGNTSPPRPLSAAFETHSENHSVLGRRGGRKNQLLVHMHFLWLHLKKHRRFLALLCPKVHREHHFQNKSSRKKNNNLDARVRGLEMPPFLPHSKSSI